MPTSLEAAALFVILLVPGLQLIAGYNRTRAHTLPRRDLYVLAQGFVASLAWLPMVWLLGGRAVLGWFFEREYRPNGDDVEVLEHQGIFIDATEVRSVRLGQTEDDRLARRHHRQGPGSA